MIAVIRDIDTDGGSLEITCAYIARGGEIETCSFRFGERYGDGGASDNDSRLFRELFGFDSVVSDSVEDGDFEDISISGAAAEIADYPERYTNEVVYFSEAPKDGTIPAEAVHSYEERPEDRETLESLREALINGQRQNFVYHLRG